jgi:hypothetical protein
VRLRPRVRDCVCVFRSVALRVLQLSAKNRSDDDDDDDEDDDEDAAVAFARLGLVVLRLAEVGEALFDIVFRLHDALLDDVELVTLHVDQRRQVLEQLEHVLHRPADDTKAKRCTRPENKNRTQAASGEGEEQQAAHQQGQASKRRAEATQKQ